MIQAHTARHLQDHCAVQIPVNSAMHQTLSQSRIPVPRHRLHLSAVLCIQSSHYVCYAKTANAKWLFYDSFADLLVPEVRQGAFMDFLIQ